MKSEEHYIQKAFFDWLEQSIYNQWFDLVCAIPNGGKRTKRQGAWLKAEGLKPGMPDTWFSIPTYTYPGMYIEFKKPGGKLTPAQKKRFPLLIAQGYKIEICYDWIIARDIFIHYIKDARCTILPSSEK